MSRLRVGTIGAGYFSQFHHDAWSRIPEVDLVAVCDLDPAKATAFAERWSIPAVYDDVGAMLDGENLDLVDIITPPPTHLDLIRETAQRRLKTICQKAFCRSLAEAEEAVAVAEKAGILLVVHENFRFQPWYREIRRQLDAGVIGELYGTTFRFRPGDGQGPQAYLDRQPYFQTMERLLVHETGIHYIDVFRFLFGEVASVLARTRRLNKAIVGEDAAIVLFEFESGMRAVFDGNRLSDHIADDRRLTMGEMLIEGSAGTIRLDGHGRLFRRPFGANAESEIAYAWESRGAAGDSVHGVQRHVVDHLLHGQPVANAARDYLANLRIEEAVYASAASGALRHLRP